MASPRTTHDRDAKHAVIDHAVLGDNTIVAAVAGKRIQVLSYTIAASGGANTIRFESGASGTALTGQMNLAANGSLAESYNPGGCFAPTAVSALLNLELSAATSVDGHLSYVEID